MKQLGSDLRDGVARFLLKHLGLDQDSNIEYGGSGTEVQADIIIQGVPTYYIDLKQRATFESIAGLNAYKDLLARSDPNASCKFILATKSISDRLDEMAEQLGIQVIIVPKEIELPFRDTSKTAPPIKISSEKSWRVFCEILRSRTSSIRRLSIETGVSYGWTHATIEYLIDKGVVARTPNRVTVGEVGPIMSGVAWERPVANLIRSESATPFRDVFEAAREISSTIERQGMKAVLCCYIAGTIYTGQSVRFDAIQVYCEDRDAFRLREIFHSEGAEGIKLQILTPDRDVFSGSRKMDGAIVSSPCQTLLDLAGLGYKGKDLTLAMASRYDTL